jgi:plasmid replication initiation protein
MAQIQKNSLVVKSNSLINASYKLSLIEQQLLILAAIHAREKRQNLLENQDIVITVSEFANAYGLPLNGSLYDNLKSATKSLFNRAVTIHDPEWVGLVRWVQGVFYKRDSSAIRLVFSKEVAPYLTALESNFTSYPLEKIGNLTSVYAVRLYELLIQFKTTGLRILEIDELRNILGLTTEYSLFKDLRVNVIELAIEQINQHTDIKVKYEATKTGRKFTHLEFRFKVKEEPKKLTTAQKVAKASSDKLTDEQAQRGAAEAVAKDMKDRFNTALYSMSVFEFETRLLQHLVMLPSGSPFALSDDAFNTAKVGLARRLGTSNLLTAETKEQVLSKYFDLSKSLRAIPLKGVFLAQLEDELTSD